MVFGSPPVVRRVIGFVVFSLDVIGFVKGDFVVVIDFVVLTFGHFASHSLRLAVAVFMHFDRA